MQTPLERATLAGREVWLIHELGAFKSRGALPTIEAFREQGAATVVTGRNIDDDLLERARLRPESFPD